MNKQNTPPDTLCHRAHEPECPLRKLLLSRATAFQLRSCSNIGDTIPNNSRDKMNRVIQIANLCVESYKWKNSQAGRIYSAKGLSPTILATVIGGGWKMPMYLAGLNNNEMKKDLIYHEHPTKEQLVVYFSGRIQIRKMTENEAARLMGLSDEDIDKINAYPFDSMAERKAFIAQADKRQLNRIKRKSISKTAKYKCYGNSIVVDVVYHLFRTMFLDNQPESEESLITQTTLFNEC